MRVATTSGAITSAIAISAIALVCAPTAAATVVQARGPDDRYADPGGFDITGGMGERSAITVDWNAAQQILVVNDIHKIHARTCTHLSPTRVRCKAPISEISLNIATGFRADRVEVNAAAGTYRSLISGGSANDILIGGAGLDDISGDGDNDIERGRGGNDDLGDAYLGGGDRLYGGPGRDFLFGGPGKQSFYGGPGNDMIGASDYCAGCTPLYQHALRDRFIDCGAGDADSVDVDARTDPAPLRCEQVRVVPRRARR